MLEARLRSISDWAYSVTVTSLDSRGVRVFINYRRNGDSSRHVAGRVYDRLCQEFGKERVFMDIEAIPLGRDYVDYIESQVAQCGYILALIGPGWLDARDEQGRRRLEDPSDWVRMELSVALRRGIPVVPLLVDGAKLPKVESLPSELSALLRRQALTLTDSGFHRELDRLVAEIGAVDRGGTIEPGGTVVGIENSAGLSGVRSSDSRIVARSSDSPVVRATSEGFKPRNAARTGYVVIALMLGGGALSLAVIAGRRGLVSTNPAASGGVSTGVAAPANSSGAFKKGKGSSGLAAKGQGATRSHEVEPIPCTTQPMPSRVAAVKDGMVRIPAGSFCMGSNDGKLDETPVHLQQLESYEIDVTEVTVAAYTECVQAKKCVADVTKVFGNWVNPEEQNRLSKFCNMGRPGHKTHPMNCVSWYQAKTYCESQDKRLPSEAEWEYAARGTDGRVYPWGSAEGPGFQLLNQCGPACKQLIDDTKAGLPPKKSYGTLTDGYNTTAPVGKYPKGQSPFELLDMAGNVREWTGDFHTESYKSAPHSTHRVNRGGGWLQQSIRQFRATARDEDDPDDRHVDLGFRCARSLGNKSTSG